MKKPLRRHSIQMIVHADTKEAMYKLFNHAIDQINSGESSETVALQNGGFNFLVQKNLTQTPARYQEQLAKWDDANGGGNG